MTSAHEPLQLGDVDGRIHRPPPKAGEKIAASIRADIVSGHLADGQYIGSQDDLTKRFAVSKPTLREAFRVLEAEGLIEIERGAYGGVIARRPDESHTTRAASMILASRQVPLADVYEARRVIECASAASWRRPKPGEPGSRNWSASSKRNKRE